MSLLKGCFLFSKYLLPSKCPLHNYCLKTWPSLSFGRISLAENNGNKRSSITTVTPGVMVSVCCSMLHGSPD